MHEMSLINSLMQKIDRVAAQQGGARVVGVTVRLGALAHISADHFREHFEQGSRGTVSEGAALHIMEDPDQTASSAQDILLESIEVAQ